MELQIAIDPLTGPQIAALLRDHLADMHRISPPESVHALDLARLRASDVTFWSAWHGNELVGCAALRELDGRDGEVKSMRTAPAHRCKGVASALLAHLIDQARLRSYWRLSLETGTQPEFAPARALYERFGFAYCGPFASYVEDPCSAFMTRTLIATHSENPK